MAYLILPFSGLACNSTATSDPVASGASASDKGIPADVADASAGGPSAINAPTSSDNAFIDNPVSVALLPDTFEQVIPASLVSFKMVLVPGDEAKGIAPFYLGAHEVTWDEFIYWALCEDISEKKAVLQRDKKLRPSAPHDSERIYRGWGRAGQPAVGLSHTAAELYCRWLSEETGRTFRLPTESEWDYAFEKGGMSLSSTLEKNELEHLAWFAGNTFDENTFDNRAMPVGQLEPNALGLHDMLGNVAEWVVGDSDERFVRGGCFLTRAEVLIGDWREAEDQNIWNKNYPNEPKSIWWYVDADYVGFRIACDP